jgi:hypothetical protein
MIPLLKQKETSTEFDMNPDTEPSNRVNFKGDWRALRGREYLETMSDEMKL